MDKLFNKHTKQTNMGFVKKNIIKSQKNQKIVFFLHEVILLLSSNKLFHTFDFSNIFQ